MDKKINLNNFENFFLNENVSIDISNFFYALIFSAILAFIIKYTYLKVSKSLNHKEHFSEIFVPLAIVTTLVITVVKFSLALSLGLVGALSIVRFRAAIKEPEELVYLFLIIGIGLANGANQFFVALLSTIVIISILFLRNLYVEKFFKKNYPVNTSTNILQIQISANEVEINDLINKIKDELKYLSLKSFSLEKNISIYNYWFEIDEKLLDNFLKITKEISLKYNEVKIQVYSRSGIYE